MCLVIGVAASSCTPSGSQTALPLSSGVTAQTAPVISQSPRVTTEQSQFQFPQKTCGDKPSGRGDDIWYPVFLNEGDLKKIRTQYCTDAIATVRKTTGVKAVQVASFISRAKADAFADAIGAEVGESTIPAASVQKPTPQASNGTMVASQEMTMQRRGALFSQDPRSQINVRDAASIKAYARHIGYAGDAVDVNRKKLGDDSKTWYHVLFESGAEGWVREEFISFGTEWADSPEPRHSSSSDSLLRTSPPIPPSTSSGGSGRCQYPDDLDSRGHRCGKRAASVRPGGN